MSDTIDGTIQDMRDIVTGTILNQQISDGQIFRSREAAEPGVHAHWEIIDFANVS